MVAAGVASFSDFVSMDSATMSAALGGLVCTSKAFVVTIMQGNTVSFGIKEPNS